MNQKRIKEKVNNCSDHLRWIGELFIEYSDNMDNTTDHLKKFELIDELLFCHSENLKVFCEKRNNIAKDLNDRGMGKLIYN